MSMEEDIKRLGAIIESHAGQIAYLQGVALALYAANVALLESVKLKQPLRLYAELLEGETLFSGAPDASIAEAQGLLAALGKLRPPAC